MSLPVCCLVVCLVNRSTARPIDERQRPLRLRLNSGLSGQHWLFCSAPAIVSWCSTKSKKTVAQTVNSAGATTARTSRSTRPFLRRLARFVSTWQRRVVAEQLNGHISANRRKRLFIIFFLTSSPSFRVEGNGDDEFYYQMTTVDQSDESPFFIG